MKKHIGEILLENRMEKRISRAELCCGICSVSELIRIEQKQKTANFFLLDRLFERLGDSPERLQYILPYKTYLLYELQYRIQERLCRRDYAATLDLLEEFESKMENSGIHRQFVAAAYAQIAWMRSEENEKTELILRQAIKETMPEEKAWKCEIVLSAEEVRLLLFRWEISQKTNKKRSINEVLELLDYMEHRKFSLEELAKIYPYASLLLDEYGDESVSENYQFQCIEYSLKILRKEERILFLPEILEIQARMTERELQDAIKSSELRRMKDALLDLEEEYEIHLEKYRLFHCINRSFALDYEMIRQARLACHMTMEELSEGICSWEQISRIERGKCKPNDKTLSRLQEKMGRKKGRTDTYISAPDYETIRMEKEVARAFYKFEYNDAERVLRNLEQNLDMTDYINCQYIENEKVRLKVQRHEITCEEAIRELWNILGMTLSTTDKKEVFTYRLNATEINILNQIAKWYDVTEDWETAANIWKGLRKNLEESACNPIFVIREWGMISSNLSSLLSVMDEMEEALHICRRGIELTLMSGRANLIPRMLTTIACIREETKEECLTQFYQALRVAKLTNSQHRYQSLVDYLLDEDFQGFREEEV